MIPVRRTPMALDAALRAGVITNLQFQILYFIYGRMDVATGKMSGYSAHVFCVAHQMFLKKGKPTESGKKRVRRAMHDLIYDRGLVCWNYVQGDETPFDVWVPTFEAATTFCTNKAENVETLWNRRLPDGAWNTFSLSNGQRGGVVRPKKQGHVRASNSTSPQESMRWGSEGTDTVCADEGRTVPLSLARSNARTEERETPLPPEGVGSPSPVADGSGHVAPKNSTANRTAQNAGNENPLGDAKHAAVILLSEFLALMSDPNYTDGKAFVPACERVARLFVEGYTPTEIVCAYASKFSSMKNNNASKANFFGGSAATAILAARLQQAACVLDADFVFMLRIRGEDWREYFQQQFAAAYAEWAKASSVVTTAPALFYDEAAENAKRIVEQRAYEAEEARKKKIADDAAAKKAAEKKAADDAWLTQQAEIKAQEDQRIADRAEADRVVAEREAERQQELAAQQADDEKVASLGEVPFCGPVTAHVISTEWIGDDKLRFSSSDEHIVDNWLVTYPDVNLGALRNSWSVRAASSGRYTLAPF